jgi:hypothetical protein
MKVFLCLLFCSLIFSGFPLSGEIAASSVEPYVTYTEFGGAVGDGITCDFEAIFNTHEYANEHGLEVRAYPTGTINKPSFYIGETSARNGAIIQTNTDWGEARFIIDDNSFTATLESDCPTRMPIFTVSSKQPRMDLLEKTTIRSLVKGQTKIDVGDALGEYGALIIIRDEATVRRKAFDVNEAWGNSPKQDIIRVCKNGNVDPKTPIIWDFPNIAELTAIPVENELLTLSGGHFDIKPHLQNLKSYVNRGLIINRSNVILDGFRYTIDETGLVFHDAPTNRDPKIASYGGTIVISGVSNVIIQNVEIMGHRRSDRSIGSTYGLMLSAATNITFINVTQTNCIEDNRFWGTMGGNDAKNVTATNMTISRFDIHRQVHNVTISNSDIGWSGILVTGGGTLLVEGTTVRHWGRFIEFREDWGSTWDGNVIIKNSTWMPPADATGNLYIIHVVNDGRFDFGFNTFMPKSIEIDGLEIKSDRNLHLVNNFIRLSNNNPITLTENLTVENVDRTITIPYFLRTMTISNRQNIRFSPNPFQIGGIIIGGLILLAALKTIITKIKEAKN